MKINDPEVKAEWTKRLKSGEIPQGSRQLGDDTGKRCCLGVLCDIAVDRKVIPAPAKDRDGRLYYDEESSILPEKVAEWAFGPFDQSAPGDSRYSPVAGAHSLAEWNDGGNCPAKTFPEIAELIEEYL